jgi:hypothetical protein
MTGPVVVLRAIEIPLSSASPHSGKGQQITRSQPAVDQQGEESKILRVNLWGEKRAARIGLFDLRPTSCLGWKGMPG